MPRVTPIARAIVLACLLCMMLAACSDEKPELARTQVTLRVRPDAELIAAIRQVKLRVYRLSVTGWVFASEASVNAERIRWPLDVPILPSSASADNRIFEVIVEGYAGRNRLAQARIISNFAIGSLRLLELGLYACPHESAGEVCAPDACHGDGCANCGPSASCEPVARIDASALPKYEPTRSPDESSDDGGLDGGSDPDDRDAASPGEAASPNCDANCDAGPVEPEPCAGGCPATKPACEQSTQSCVECTEEAHCSGTKRHCDRQTCVECATDGHCAAPSPFCVGQRCVACRGPADCPASAKLCVASVCAATCATSADCGEPGASCDPNTKACVCAPAGMTCQGGSLVEQDSCGKTTAVRSGCCGRGCTGAACNAPDPRASIGCSRGNLYYLDSCGLPGEMMKTCCGQGCQNGACVPPAPQARLTCFNGDSFYEDSCGVRGAMAQYCCGLGCTGAGICAPINRQASRMCVQGNAYWRDSCGTQADLIEDCAGRGCVSGFCST